MRYVCPECFGQGKTTVHDYDCTDEYCQKGREEECALCVGRGFPPSFEIFMNGTRLARQEVVDVEFTVVEVKALEDK